MPISIRIEGLESLDKTAQGIQTGAASLKERFLYAAVNFGNEAVARSKKDYLSGPRPQRLGRVSGRLASSITSQVTYSGNDIDTTVGTRVEYGPRWELGFIGRERVRAHIRTVNKVFGRSVRPRTVFVKSFSRKIDIKPRPFIRPAVEDALPAFEARIRELLSGAALGRS